MDSLTDDALSYLIEIILDNSGCFDLTSFLVCHRIKLISDEVVNDKLKINYKILIRNNNLKSPLHAYNNVYEIYGDKFVVSKNKLNHLLFLAAKKDNVELLKILLKTIPKTIKLSKIKYVECPEIDFFTLYLDSLTY